MLIPKIIKFNKFSDNRGYFREGYNKIKFIEMGIDIDFVQEGESFSSEIGTLRGLHFQLPPYAQDKLVKCVRGAIFDVIVDIRKGSPNYGKWKSFTLSEDNGDQLFIPKGFAHGFVTLEKKTIICYKFSDYYNQIAEKSLYWNDKDIGIDWIIKKNLVINEKDSLAPLLKDFNSPFIWGNKF